MVAWKRFPVPEFDHEAFKAMGYAAPTLLSVADAEALIAKRAGGDESVCGGHAVMPDDALFERFAVQGEHRHAVLCLLPEKSCHVVGRTYAWPIEGVFVLDSLDPASATALHEWKTPRPMNTLIGPEDGVELAGGAYVIMTGHRYADHWVSNRSIIENDWDPGDGRAGFRILCGSDDDKDDFHNCVLSFTWPA